MLNHRLLHASGRMFTRGFRHVRAQRLLGTCNAVLFKRRQHGKGLWWSAPAAFRRNLCLAPRIVVLDPLHGATSLLLRPLHRVVHDVTVAEGKRWRGRVAAVTLGVAACSRGGPPEFTVRDVAVVVNSDAAFTRAGDFPARLQTTIDAALTYWGGNWDQLAGKVVDLEGASALRCGTVEHAVGCSDDAGIRISTKDAGAAVRCVEETVLVHEIGHAVIGDPDHRDPRWMDFADVARQLDGRLGYTETGVSDCPVYVNVWRHPPSTTQN